MAGAGGGGSRREQEGIRKRYRSPRHAFDDLHLSNYAPLPTLHHLEIMSPYYKSFKGSSPLLGQSPQMHFSNLSDVYSAYQVDK